MKYELYPVEFSWRRGTVALFSLLQTSTVMTSAPLFRRISITKIIAFPHDPSVLLQIFKVLSVSDTEIKSRLKVQRMKKDKTNIG